ncbi:MAG: hypothetical protein JW928_01640 [Candidatus Aureabacteria bacterium]|nr:hypothetical protein [Candidatus Auribacterota bacterium]
MKNKILFLLITMTLLFSVFHKPSDTATVELKNGKLLEGQLSSANESVIVLRYNFGEIEFPIKRISHIRDLSPEEIEVLQKSSFFDKHYHLVKSVALPKSDVELTDESYEYTKQAAIEALQALKNKMEEKFQKEKEDIHGSYSDQIAFLEEKVNALSSHLDTLEREKSSLEQKVASLQKDSESCEKDIEIKESRFLALQQEMQGLKNKFIEKEKESAEKIKEIISENENLYNEEITALRSSYEAEISSLKTELGSLQDEMIQKDKKANENLMATLSKLEDQHKAEKEALVQHYESQIQALMERHSLAVENLKKDLNDMRADLMQSEARAQEKVAQVSREKEKYYSEEKAALVNKYRTQIDTLKTEIANLSIQNESLLKKDNERQATLLKLKSEERGRMETIEKLQNQVESLKKDLDNQALAYIEEFDKEKTSLKTMVASSSDKLAQMNQEKKALLDNIDLLQGEIQSVQKSNDVLQQKMALLEKENSIVKQEKEILAQKIKESDRIRDAEKDEIVVGIVSEALKTEVESPGQVSEKELALSEDAKAAREVLIELYKEDLIKLQDKIEEKNNEIKRIASENLSMKQELEKLGREKTSALDELESVKKRYAQIEKEKQEIKDNADLIIQQVRQQAKAEIDQEKESLRQSYNEVITSIEKRISEVQPSSMTVLQGIPVEQTSVEIPITVPEEEIETSAYEIPAKSHPMEPEPVEEAVTPPSKLVQTGTVSDVGTDYGRIYIETISSVNKGDVLWVKKDDGKSYQFKVIQVIPALSGAIAEIAVPGQIGEINKNDPVFSME